VRGFPGAYTMAAIDATMNNIPCPVCKYGTGIPHSFPLPNIAGIISYCTRKQINIVSYTVNHNK
jgi:hypothetical protein